MTRRTTTLVLAGITAALGACESDDDPTGPLVEPDGPAEIASRWATALDSGDPDLLESTLDPDYTYLAPAGALVRFETLTRAQEVSILGEMSARASEIEASIEMGRVTSSDVPGYPGDDGYLEADVTLTLRVRVPGPAWIDSLEVPAHDLRFVFAHDSTSTPPGGFRIIHVRDSGAPAPVTTGLAELKARFVTFELPPFFLPPDEPENVIENFRIAHARRDLEVYAAAIDADFVFRPASADPDVTYDLLDRAQDLEATRALFDGTRSVTAELEHGDPTASDVADYIGDEYLRILVPQATVVASTVIENVPTHYRVDGDPIKFILRREDADDPPTYTIIFQQDLHQGRAQPVVPTSWSALKVAF